MSAPPGCTTASAPALALARRARGLPRTRHAAHAVPGLLGRAAAAAGAGHAELPAARGRHRPHHHRLPELGRPGLRLQVGLGAAGGPAADPAADHAARAAPRLAAAGAGDGRSPASSAWPSTIRAPALDAAGLVRAAGGLRLGHAGHRARRLPHRIGRHAQAGRAGRRLPDRLPAGDDLGRRRRAVDRRLGRGRRRRRLPERRLEDRLPRDGGLDGGGRDHGAAVARAGARARCRTAKNAGRVAARAC